MSDERTRYVVHTGEDLEYYDDEGSAVEAANRAIQDWRDMCDPEWPNEVECVWVAKVTHESNRVDRGDDDGVDYCDYELESREKARGGGE